MLGEIFTTMVCVDKRVLTNIIRYLMLLCSITLDFWLFHINTGKLHELLVKMHSDFIVIHFLLWKPLMPYDFLCKTYVLRNM